MEQVLEATNQLAKLVLASYAKNSESAAKRVHAGEYQVIITEGSRYYKVVIADPYRHVHAFVDKSTGDLYKASGWSAPAKGTRFNVLKDMDILKDKVDWCGGYLYR